MDIYLDVVGVLKAVLGKSFSFDVNDQLFGAVPELDSMAVVSVIEALEERFEIFFEDDEVTAEMFETVGSLCEAVERKLNEG